MSDLEILNQLIKHSARIPLQLKDEKYMVVLTEPDAPDSTVTICGIPQDSIIIKVDEFKSPDHVFHGTKGECKRADFVIISGSETKKRILFIEMKRTSALAHEIQKQLGGALCFIHYCREIGKHFWKDRDFLKDYQPRFAYFLHTSVLKMPTRIDRCAPKNDTPDKALRISSPYKQQFNQLVGA